MLLVVFIDNFESLFVEFPDNEYRGKIISVAMNYFWRYDSTHVFLTLSCWSYTTWCDHHRAGREFRGPWDCFHFLSVFLQKRSWKIWRIVANLPRETSGKKGTIDFSCFCRIASPRLKYRAGGIHYGNREPTVTWIEENSVMLTDEREGRCFRKENGKISGEDVWSSSRSFCARLNIIAAVL